MSSPPLVVAMAELAQLLGVSKNRAMAVAQKAGFPSPVAKLSVGRVWSYDAVVEFCESTGRKVYPLTPLETEGDVASE
jgi:hypothetical protein